MRKIFTFLFAALMSVGMYALTPKGTDVWDETTKTLTVNGNPVSYAYSGVSDIENLVISDAVTSIGDDAFYNCIGLKSVSFSSSLTSLGEEAFANCSKLESVTLPASLESIGKSAFYTCGNLTEVTIPDGVTSIGQQAFYFCEKLTSVTIPNSVASIGGQAFLRCGGLTGIVVAAENPNYSSEDGVLFNKDKTTLIQYPGGKQGEYTIPNSVTSIGRLAFSMCSLLTSVEIPNSVEEIVDYAFQSCSGLTSVTIGNGIAKIGGYAFYYSSKLASVTINATTPPTLGGSALDKTAAALTIYVPAASVTAYKSKWTAYADKIVAAAEPEPAGEVTVVFAANNKTVERTVTLPHTFKCSWDNGMDGPDELDIIIHELYNDYYYCNSNMNASGSDQVEVGTEEAPKNDYITIKGVFEGTATVTGDYFDWITGEEGAHNYSITISIKGGSATAVENVQTNQVQGSKILRNGQLLIEKNGKIYNVMGAEVK
ncbi:MAG: leucine-rich repeat domain-containing protein [Paludibacteraceae bacterium]|nr:leucine-rich repeat domain-containing protein [Paludibacteraceae bacterium]MBQ6763642.1 leucine-rich repeat domain-containing protein [Paludibacteraceae bacterium]